MEDGSQMAALAIQPGFHNHPSISNPISTLGLDVCRMIHYSLVTLVGTSHILVDYKSLTAKERFTVCQIEFAGGATRRAPRKSYWGCDEMMNCEHASAGRLYLS